MVSRYRGSLTDVLAQRQRWTWAPDEASASQRALHSAAQSLAERERRLTALSPDGVLARGYALALDEASGRVLRAATDSSAGSRVRVRLGRGALRTRVDEVLE